MSGFFKELIGINKLRWYSHQPQRFLVEACCEAKRWKHLRLVSVSQIAANPVEPDPALHQSLPDLLWNLLRNPVEPDLALHQSLPEPFPEPSPEPCWTWPGSAPKPKPPRNFSGTFFGTLLNLTSFSTKASQTFSGTFSGTLLNLTWLCTKASQTFSGTFSGTLLNLTWLCTKASQKLLRNLLRNPVEPDLALHQSLPYLLRNLLRSPVEPDLALHQSLPDLLRNLLRNPVEPDLALHQSLSEASPEPSSEPCWTWPGSAPKPPGTSKPPRPSPEPLDLAWLCTKASQTFSRIFSGTPKPPRPSPEPSEPSPESCWTWPSACTSAHRSYSGLKTPLAYAVGENMQFSFDVISFNFGASLVSDPKLFSSTASLRMFPAAWHLSLKLGCVGKMQTPLLPLQLQSLGNKVEICPTPSTTW